MRKTAFILILSLLSTGNLRADTADAAVASAEATTSSDWQNWIFTATTLVTAAAAVIVVAIDDGHSAH